MGTVDEIQLENQWIEALNSLASNCTETLADQRMRSHIDKLIKQLNSTDEFFGDFLTKIVTNKKLDDETLDPRIIEVTQDVRKFCRLSEAQDNKTTRSLGGSPLGQRRDLQNSDARNARKIHQPNAPQPRVKPNRALQINTTTEARLKAEWISNLTALRNDDKKTPPGSAAYDKIDRLIGESKSESDFRHILETVVTYPKMYRGAVKTMALEMLARHQGATAPVKNIDYQSRQTSKAHTVDDQNRSHERHSPQTAAPTDRASSRQMTQRWLNVLIEAREKLSSQINSGIHGEDRSIAQRRFAKVSALIGKARLLDENDPQSIMGAIRHARLDLADVAGEFR